MKIAIIHNQLKDGGGMESYLQSLLQGFARAGDEVHVHVCEADAAVAARFPLTLHRKSLFFLPGRYRKLYFLSWCNRHFPSARYDLSLSLTRTACQDLAVSGGVHPASLVASRRPGGRKWSFYDLREINFEEKALRRSPCIMAHSQLIEREILRYYPVDGDKIRVLYPPIDTERFHSIGEAEREEMRRRFDIDGRMTLLFPSLDHERKGLGRLLRSFEELDPGRFALLIAGRKPGKKTNLPPNVRYAGYLTNLAGLYAAVDYVVLPSLYEPFGLVVAEALQCGTPVLMTSQVGASEIVRAGEAVLIPDGHPESFADVIAGLQRKRIAPGFARDRGLEISRHIRDLKAFVLERREKEGRV